jgi:hypothetical protein
MKAPRATPPTVDDSSNLVIVIMLSLIGLLIAANLIFDLPTAVPTADELIALVGP